MSIINYCICQQSLNRILIFESFVEVFITYISTSNSTAKSTISTLKVHCNVNQNKE